MPRCLFCEKENANKGSLFAHQKYCSANTNRVERPPRSPLAGKSKGCTTWNKGLQTKDLVSYSFELITSGKILTFTESMIRKHVKRYLIGTYGHRCGICEMSDWQNQPIPLICDHIDGDSTNNELTNFRLVCCNCDAQLPTFKSKNRGNGRQYDREYKRKRVVESNRLSNEELK